MKSLPILLVTALASFGCTGLKHITRENPLFTGSQLEFTDGPVKSGNAIAEVRKVLLPVPNEQFLWMRPALARFNMLSDSTRIKNFWRNKIAPPVVLSQTQPALVSKAINNKLLHEGFFDNTVRYDTVKVGHKKARYRYTVSLNEPYRLGKITYPSAMDDLAKSLRGLGQESTLASGDIYSLEAIRTERIRIDRGLKEQGYIYFNPEFLIFSADSVTGDHVINLKLQLKPQIPPESRTPHRIGNVFIHDDHTLENLSYDTTAYAPYYVISGSQSLRFDALRRGVFLQPGTLFARSNQAQTIRYLSNLPIIQYASVKFSESQEPNRLDASIYLTQRKRYSYSAEFNTVFRSTNFFGPGVIFSYTDRNLRGGAEQLKLNLRGRFELQVSQGVVNPAYELGVEVEYTLPRLYPGFLGNLGQRKLPRTNISVGYNLFNRLDLYQLNSVFTGFGFKWSQDDWETHTLNPVEIIYTQVPESSKSDEFKDYLELNPGVQRSFDQQFVFGSGYEFIYNPNSIGRSNFYFLGGADVSGNLLNLVAQAAGVEQDSLGRYIPFGLPFSQYARTRVDFRYGYRFNKYGKLATRMVVGLGLPYGNSDILPYVKQFYVGGTNSLRSFLARSVGPGSEVPPEGFVDLTGDIRLEWNVEYRFSITRVTKGAIFVDAGNVWLYNDDPSRPNGQFRWDTFLNEIAVSSGFGFRWDFDFVVARLDLGYTIRTPYLPQGERWAQDFKILKPVFNIAIGYPF